MEIDYKDRVVAFIDVLGFSNLVYNEKTGPITKYYNMILTGFRTAADKDALEFLMISDSIVIYAPLGKTEFLTIIKIITRLQNKLLLEGILIRGGISYGKLFVNKTDNIVVGTGLINAYQLELKATYPRIIIDRKFINLYWTDSNDFESDCKGLVSLTSCKPYAKDYPFINIGKAVALNFQSNKFDSIVEFIRQNYYSNEHIIKFEWLKSNILTNTEVSLAYLSSKTINSKQELKRIRLLTDFVAKLSAL